VWCDLFYSHIDQKGDYRMIPVPAAPAIN